MGNKDIFDDEDKARIQTEYDSLVNNLLRCGKPGDRELIDKAFKIANEAHWNMRRKSGEPYIIHPISVAKIVNSEIGLGAKSIAVALLHDVVEDTEYSLEDVERDFGPKIASLIDGLTKISGTYNKENSSSLQAENFRKMLLTLSDDLRVILIKIADRLHNMRTLDSMPEQTQCWNIYSSITESYLPKPDRLRDWVSRPKPNGYEALHLTVMGPEGN